jgi:MFS family permease
VTSSLLALSSGVLALQALAGFHQLWLLYVLAGLTGGVSGLDSPARQTFIPRLLPPSQIPAATALGQISMQSSLTGGPLIGGVLIAAVGFSGAYLVDFVSFAFVLYSTLRLRSMEPLGGGTRPSLGAVADGLAWVRKHPIVGMTFYADICAMLFGMPRALFPALAVSHFHGGSEVVGVLFAAPAVGALLGAVLSGPLGRVRRQGLAILVSVFVWGATVTAFGFTHILWLGVIFLAIAGASDMVSGVFRSTILQVSAPDELRGRLQSVFFVVVAGGARLGDVESGGVAALGGVTFSAVSGGIACMVVITALAFVVPAFTRYDAEAATARP